MSSGWSWWVMSLIVLNLGISFFLFLWAPHAKIPTLPDGTTGHSWAHGALREGLHRLPRWWLALSFAMFFGAFGYLILYPGFGNFSGTLNWTSAQEHDQKVNKTQAEMQPLLQRLSQMKVEQVSTDPQALQLGQRLFKDNCAACHGLEGHGNPLLGAPNLTQNVWLYGGNGETIEMSIHDGRNGVMPAWAALGEETIAHLVQYVLSISGQAHDEQAAAQGKETFASTCSACHGTDGKGNTAIGAPNLTDSIWLYGGTPQLISKTIHEGRQGHMPTWSLRLNDQEIHVLAGYVYHLAHSSTDTKSTK